MNLNDQDTAQTDEIDKVAGCEAANKQRYKENDLSLYILFYFVFSMCVQGCTPL